MRDTTKTVIKGLLDIAVMGVLVYYGLHELNEGHLIPSSFCFTGALLIQATLIRN